MITKYKAGFAGAGHMGKILAAAAVRTGEKTAVSCSTPEHGRKAAEELGCAFAETAEIIRESEYVFLGIRPQNLEEFAAKEREAVDAADGIFVSMLAGVSLERLAKQLGAGKKMIRIMPNTPCAVGQGLIFCTASDKVSPMEKRGLELLLAACGTLEWIDEKDMDAVSVLGGCGPAYVYAYADSLAKAGESMGLDSSAAVRYAAQMILGSACMMLETGKTPEALKKEVCSPGGTTIEGVKVLDQRNLEGTVSEALQASFRKTRGMSAVCQSVDKKTES